MQGGNFLVQGAVELAQRAGVSPLIVGLTLLIIGGKLLVEGAIDLATTLGISEAMIGLTIVAVGTSMPELVTSIVAAMKKQTSLAFGNIIGSNIFNLLGIGGVAGILAPGPVPESIAQFDNPIMLVAFAIFLFFAYTASFITRKEGGTLLLAYFFYVYLIWP